MQIALHSSARRALFLGPCLLLASTYFTFCTRQFLAAHFSAKPEEASLLEASKLEPSNADYQYRLGRYYLLARREPETALHFYQAAVGLNPHVARYWFDLSTAYQLLGDAFRQEQAVRQAILADPTTPDIAWEAANLYWVQGRTTQALQEFRVVLANDASLTPAALERCWRILPDTDALLHDVVPRNAGSYSAFLEFLISKNQPVAAAKVWAQLAALQQPVELRHIFTYIRYLIGERDPDQAQLVWQQSANLSDLSAYQPSVANLVVNGDFSLPILNGGFDWTYQSLPDVSLALDPTESHSGHRSLSIVFDSRGLEDAGIQQLIPLSPNTKYDFSAYFKSEEIEGAGGPRLLIQDRLTGDIYFASEELKGADFWKQVGGSFTTSPDTSLAVLRVQRFPAGNAIRGRLWIDGIRMVKDQLPEGGQ